MKFTEREKLRRAMEEAMKTGLSRTTMLDLIEEVYGGQFMHVTWSNRRKKVT